MKRKTGRRIALLFASIIAGFVIAEIIVRVTGSDWRYVRRNLYFQIMDLKSHMEDPSPDLLFRLTPGSKEQYSGGFRPYIVSVNSQGERGPERSNPKPSGEFRIICLGGSNVYGANLNNHET